MADQITRDELLALIRVKKWIDGSWYISDVRGDVDGDVYGDVGGTINGKHWQYVETPRQKVERLIKETGHTELLEAFNQLEDN